MEMPNEGKIYRNGILITVPFQAIKGLQTILFPNGQWSQSEARLWLRRHGMFEGLEEKGQYYRARQRLPMRNAKFSTVLHQHEGSQIEFIMQE